MAKPKPCVECGRRPKSLPRQRCAICLLRAEPIGVQAREAARRAAMVPEDLRPKLTKRMRQLAPEGQRWCAKCVTFRDEVDFRGEQHTQCWVCRNASQHASMVERTYGITRAQYEELDRLQDGRCAVCGNRPKSKRLVVDHRHSDGVVRGLLCGGSEQSGCNFAAGLLHDDPDIVHRLWAYLTSPPAVDGEAWQETLTLGHESAAGSLAGAQAFGSPSEGLEGRRKAPSAAQASTEPVACPLPHIADSKSRTAVWMTVLVENSAPPPF